MNSSSIIVIQSGDKYQCRLSNGTHNYLADEPTSEGGLDTGLSPDEWLMGALGSCTAITLRMYVERKSWDVGEIHVGLQMSRNSENGNTKTQIARSIHFTKPLDTEKINRLLAIANACPLHKTLLGDLDIKTSLNDEID